MNVEREPPLQLPASGLDVSVPAGAHRVELSGHVASLEVVLLNADDAVLDAFTVPYFANGGRSLPVGAAHVRIRPPASTPSPIEVRVDFVLGHRAAGCTKRLARRV